MTRSNTTTDNPEEPTLPPTETPKDHPTTVFDANLMKDYLIEKSETKVAAIPESTFYTLYKELLSDSKEANKIKNICAICNMMLAGENSPRILLILTHDHTMNTPHCFHFRCICPRLKRDQDFFDCAVCSKKFQISDRQLLKKLQIEDMLLIDTTKVTDSDKEEILGAIREKDQKEVITLFVREDIPLIFLERVIETFREKSSASYSDLLRTLEDTKEIKEGNKLKSFFYKKYREVDGLEGKESDISAEDLAKELLTPNSWIRKINFFIDTIGKNRKVVFDHLKNSDPEKLAHFMTDALNDSNPMIYYDLIISLLFAADTGKILDAIQKQPSEGKNNPYLKNTADLINKSRDDILNLFKDGSLEDKDRRNLYIAILDDKWEYFTAHFKEHAKDTNMPLEEIVKSDGLKPYDKIFYILCLAKFGGYGDQLRNSVDPKELVGLSISGDSETMYFVNDQLFYELISRIDLNKLDDTALFEIFDDLSQKNIKNKKSILMTLCRRILMSEKRKTISFDFFRQLLIEYNDKRAKENDVFEGLFKNSLLMDMESKVQIPEKVSKEEVVSFFGLIVTDEDCKDNTDGNYKLRAYLRLFIRLFIKLKWNEGKKAALDEILNSMIAGCPSFSNNRNRALYFISSEVNPLLKKKPAETEEMSETLIALLDSIDKKDFRKERTCSEYGGSEFNSLLSGLGNPRPAIEKMIELDAEVALDIFLFDYLSPNYHEDDTESFSKIKNSVLEKKNSRMAIMLISFFRECGLKEVGIQFAKSMAKLEFSNECRFIIRNNLIEMGEQELAGQFYTPVVFEDNTRKFVMEICTGFLYLDDIENMIKLLAESEQFDMNNLIAVLIERMLTVLSKKDIRKLDEFIELLSKNRERLMSIKINGEDLCQISRCYDEKIKFKSEEDILRYLRILILFNFSKEELETLYGGIENDMFKVLKRTNSDGTFGYDNFHPREKKIYDLEGLKEKILKMISSYFQTNC